MRAHTRKEPKINQIWTLVCVRAQLLSHIRLSATPWTVAHQVPLSMGFSRQELGVGCHFLLQGGLPDPGIIPVSPASFALAGGFFITSATWEVPNADSEPGKGIRLAKRNPEEMPLKSGLNHHEGGAL